MPLWLKMVTMFMAILIFSFLVATGIVTWANAANADAIDACARLGGQITVRGWNCELPDGLIVDPIKWEKSR